MRLTPVLTTLSLLFCGSSYAVARAADQPVVAAPQDSKSLVTVENGARLKGLNRVAIAPNAQMPRLVFMEASLSSAPRERRRDLTKRPRIGKVEHSTDPPSAIRGELRADGLS